MQEFIVHKVDDHQMIGTNQANNEQYSFDGYTNEFATASENPFSIQNNHWRSRKDHKESEREITEKLKNHFPYWEKFIAWELKTDIGNIDYSASPGPFNMYEMALPLNISIMRSSNGSKAFMIPALLQGI